MIVQEGDQNNPYKDNNNNNLEGKDYNPQDNDNNLQEDDKDHSYQDDDNDFKRMMSIMPMISRRIVNHY